MVERKEKEWDLVEDGFLWKDVLLGFPDNPEFKKQVEMLVGRLQKTADRTDFLQLILFDRRASNYLRQIALRRFEAAHRRLGLSAASESLSKTPSASQDSATECAIFPRPEIVDTILRHDLVLDRQSSGNSQLAAA